MALLTLKKVNLALLMNGADEELVKGKDYFYFNAPAWGDTMVYVPRLNDLTLDQWIDDWRSRRDEFNNQA